MCCLFYVIDLKIQHHEELFPIPEGMSITQCVFGWESGGGWGKTPFQLLLPVSLSELALPPSSSAGASN